MSNAGLEVILIDENITKVSPKELRNHKRNIEWINSSERIDFLRKKKYFRTKDNKMNAFIAWKVRTEFDKKIDLCEKIEFNIRTAKDYELIKYKHQILFNMGKFEQSTTSISMNFFAILICIFTLVMPIIEKIYDLTITDNKIQIFYYYLILIGVLLFLIYPSIRFKDVFDVRYGHNNILLDYQLKMVEEELERRKNEKLEVQQLSSRQFNRSSNNKEIRHNRKTRGKR